MFVSENYNISRSILEKDIKFILKYRKDFSKPFGHSICYRA